MARSRRWWLLAGVAVLAASGAGCNRDDGGGTFENSEFEGRDALPESPGRPPLSVVCARDIDLPVSAADGVPDELEGLLPPPPPLAVACEANLDEQRIVFSNAGPGGEEIFEYYRPALIEAGCEIRPVGAEPFEQLDARQLPFECEGTSGVIVIQGSTPDYYVDWE